MTAVQKTPWEEVILHPIEEHIEYLYAAAHRICQNPTEAEDLTHDTILQAMLQLRQGVEVTNMKAWLYGIMKNTHAMNLRKKYRMPTVSINGMDFASRSSEIDAMMEQEEKTEEARKIRREIAYLSRMYRDIIVNYYFHGKSVEEIARSMGIPEGTVKSRLFNGREKLKKGYTKMAIQQSGLHLNTQYMQPKELNIYNSGVINAPFKRVMGNLMLQNVLLAAYEKPVTPEEIAHRMGIPTAYIEDAAETLLNVEMLKQEGGKVSTAIVIFSIEDRYRFIEGKRVFVDLNYGTVAGILEKSLGKLREMPLYTNLAVGERAQKKLEFFLIMAALEDGLYYADEANQNHEITVHENGLTWDAWGEIRKDMSLSKEILDTVSNADEKYSFAGQRTSWYENNHFHEYDTFFDSFKCYYIAKLLCMIGKGEDVTDERELQCIPDLIERGILAREGDRLQVDIPVLTPEDFGNLETLKNECVGELLETLRPVMTEYLSSRRMKVPAHLQVTQPWMLTMPATEHLQMMFVHKMVENKLLFHGINYPCPAKVLVVTE